MNTIAAQEVKRRGIAAVDDVIGDGPVFVIKNNTPRYVVMMAADYERLLADLTEARLAASEADLAIGRIGRGSAGKLMTELLSK